MERLRVLRILGLIVDHTSGDEQLRMGPDTLAGEFGLDPAATRDAYERLEGVGALRPTGDGWSVPGARHLHGQGLRPADALDAIAAVLAGTETPTAAVLAGTETPTAPDAPAPAATGPSPERVPTLATLPTPVEPTDRPVGSSVLVAAALVVVVGLAALLFGSGRATAPVEVATGPTAPVTAPSPGPGPVLDDLDRLGGLVTRHARRTPPLPRAGSTAGTGTTTTTAGRSPSPGTTTPGPAAAEPTSPVPGPLGADPPGELACPVPPPTVTITTTAAVSQLDFAGWVLIVRGVVEGHPDHDAVIEEILAHVVIDGTEVTDDALDEPVRLAAGDRLEWQAELSVPTGSAPPHPRAALGGWRWADPAHGACP